MGRRRGAARLVTLATILIAGGVTALHEIPAPESFWPITYGAWIATILATGSALSILYVFFGPFLGKRLRGFLDKDEDTRRLLRDIVWGILGLKETGLFIRDLVLALFHDRLEYTDRIRSDLDVAMRQIGEAEVKIAANSRHLERLPDIQQQLGRIEEQNRAIQQELSRLAERRQYPRS